MNFDYYIPTKILFGAGSLRRLHQESLPGKKALIVITAGGSMRRNGYLDRVIEQLNQSGVGNAVYDGVQPNPTKDNVMEGAAVGKENGCDFVLGLGGGSSIDAAKAMSLMMVNPGDYWDYINGGSAKGLPFLHQPLPVVTVVTTAGTGTEADPWTVVTKEDTQEKIGFGGSSMFPVLSVVDAELMTSIPQNLTAFQGFDALFHSAEGYINREVSPVSDLFCEKSLELLGESLSDAVNCGSNLAARENVALASTIAGFVQSTSGCVSEHALAHAMGAFHPNVPHGAALIMISRSYFRHFVQAGVCDERFLRMARLLGKTDAKEPMDFVEALTALQARCGVAELKMSDYGFQKGEINGLVQNARHTMGGMFANDRAALADEEVAAILEASFR